MGESVHTNRAKETTDQLTRTPIAYLAHKELIQTEAAPVPRFTHGSAQNVESIFPRFLFFLTEAALARRPEIQETELEIRQEVRYHAPERGGREGGVAPRGLPAPGDLRTPERNGRREKCRRVGWRGGTKRRAKDMDGSALATRLLVYLAGGRVAPRLLSRGRVA